MYNKDLQRFVINKSNKNLDYFFLLKEMHKYWHDQTLF